MRDDLVRSVLLADQRDLFFQVHIRIQEVFPFQFLQRRREFPAVILREILQRLVQILRYFIAPQLCGSSGSAGIGPLEMRQVPSSDFRMMPDDSRHSAGTPRVTPKKS